MSHRILVWVASLVFTSCSLVKKQGDSKTHTDVPMPDPLYGSPLGLTGELNEFGSCAELEGWLREETLKRTAYDLAWEKHHYFRSSRDVVWDSATADTASAEGAASSGHTSTNNQVANVDENDRMKHVGDRIYALTPYALHTVKSWPVSEMTLTGSLTFPDPVESMLIVEEHAVVFGSSYHYDPSYGLAARSIPVEPGCSSGACNPHSITSVRLVDLTTPAATLVRVETFRAQLIAARQSGAKVRYVLQASLPSPNGFKSHANLWTHRPETPEDADRIIATIVENNAALLSAWTLADWTDQAAKLAETDCRSVYRPTAHGDLALTTVTTVDPASGDEQVTAVLARASEVYASETNLYVAHRYWGGHDTAYAPHTFLHKFSLLEEGSRYEASGNVEGSILNQFALDENDGHLRVAVTTRTSQAGRNASLNRVVVLGQEGASLVVRGQTPDLAPGESIHGVRFDGDKGYVVTFRTVDPLFVLDLSDPAAPKVTGELKIPGFSSYLHKVSDSRLLGVGEQNGRLKLSLFDISNPAAPTELHSLLQDGWSDVRNDHRSFAFAPWLSTFVLTFSPSGTLGYGLASFSIVNDTIVKGRYFPTQRLPNGSQVALQNGRSVFRDNILYTVTAANVAAYDLTQQGGSLVGNVLFP